MNKKATDTLEHYIHVPVFLTAILVLMLKLVLPPEVALEHVYQPPYLSFVLNTIFITAISFWIAWQTVRGYLASGFVPFLVLGCALLAAGSTALIAGLLFDRPDGFNHAATVYNLGFLLSTLLHFINACLLGGKEERVETAEGSRKLVSSLAYPAVFLAVGGIWAADYHALLPRFFNPGSGPTMIREVVHTATILLLGIASYLLLNLARQRKAGYLRWYGFGLALIAVGFFGSAFGVPGSPISWAGRASRYLGNIYLLASAVYAYREALREGMGWEEAAREFFRESEGRYRTLVQSARSSIISVDRHQRIFLWNPSAERLFGYTADEVMGQGVTGLIALPDSRETLEGIIRRSPQGVHELTLRRKDGSEFAAEFTVYGLTGRDEKSLNIRDITERKKAEEALREAYEHLEQKVRERTLDLRNLTEELEKSRNDLRKLASELVLAEERERKRVATVLHDEIAQTLAVARMRVDMLQNIAVDEQSRQTVQEAKDFLVQAIQETRALMNDLGNPLLFDIGVAAACESLADRLMAIHPIQIRCDIRDSFKDLDPEMKVVLFQVIRELLNNVIKHSGARTAHVFIHMDNEHIQATVTDDGLGFDTQTLGAPTHEGGFGLFSIRERLMAFHGDLAIESTPQKGTIARASLPLMLERQLRPGNECSE